jgi:hypothetical protein
VEEQQMTDTPTGKVRHPARRTRIAALGVGAAVMGGLVSQMEVQGATKNVTPAPPAPGKSSSAVKKAAARRALALTATRMKPIVLTPHAVVHTVSAPAPSGGYVSSGGSGYAAAAPAPAPAPVAATSASAP